MIDYDQYDALIFDCDGTLVDSMPAHFVAWTAALKPYGLSFPETRFYETGGIPSERVIEMLAGEQGISVDAQKVADEKEQAFHASIERVGPMPHVVAIARRYHGVKPLAVATGSREDVARQMLGHLEIAPMFSTLVACEHVQNHKPDPDTYLEAARRLEVDPKRCVAFEDTNVGLTSARGAGMDAVDVRELTSNGF